MSFRHVINELCYLIFSIETVSVVNEESIVHVELIYARLLVINMFVVDLCEIVGSACSFVDSFLQLLKEQKEISLSSALI